jgi:hypothetical protein
VPSLCITLTLTVLVIFTSFPVFAAKPAAIQTVRIMDGSESDFVISGNQNFQFYMFALKNPDRLVVDCRPAVLAFPIAAILKTEHPDVIKIHANSFDANAVRIVFDLKHPAKYSALMTGNDLRIRISGKKNVIMADRNEPAGEANAPKPALTPENVQMSLSTLDQRATENVRESEDKKKSDKRRVDMKGYLVDKFRRNVVRGQDSEPSMTNSYALGVKYRDKKKNSTFRIDYEIVGYEYREAFVDDYMSHDFKIGYEWKLGSKWRLKTIGRAEMDDYTGDRFGFKPELEYRIDPSSSVNFYGGHRTKIYRDYRDRIDQDRYIGMSYLRKIRNHRLELRYQRNFNDSEYSRYDYTRTRYTVSYAVPWTNRTRTLFRLDYSPKEYQSRFIWYDELNDMEFGDLRQDDGLAFSVSTRIALTKTFEIVPRYVFRDSYSNDPDVDEITLHIPSISLRGRW